MQTKRLLLTLMCLSTFTIYAQQYNEQANFLKANSVWAFGLHFGLDFNTSPPATFESKMEALEGGASVADPQTGKLLFYSDGGSVWNADHQLMPNGDSTLIGNRAPGSSTGLFTTSQGVVIVPFINDPDKYYIFSLYWGTTSHPTGYNHDLFYSVVNMRLDNGKGDIVDTLLNRPIQDTTIFSESMVAIPGNNCDIWLVVHDRLEPQFRAFRITEEGIDHTPVISKTGLQIQGKYGLGAEAYKQDRMTVSPNREYLAITSYSGISLGVGDNATGVLLCKFDPSTGLVSDALLVDTFLSAGSVAFSPDNSKLYLPMWSKHEAVQETALYQYDITHFDRDSINASKEKIAFFHSSVSPSFIRLYEGKIYVNEMYQGNTIGVINEPNLSGLACDYDPVQITIHPGTSTQMGLPTEVVYPIVDFSTSSTEHGICEKVDGFGSTELTAPTGYTDYRWSTGDTGTSIAITDTGTYWLTYSSIKGCDGYVDTFKIVPYPVEVIINVEVDTLRTVESYSSYQWYLNGQEIPGADERAYIVKENGNYTVKVTDEEGCIGISDVYPVNNVGIGSNALQQSVSVYPNPARESVFIDSYYPVNVIVCDIQGRELATFAKSNVVDITDYSEGVYIIKIIDQSGSLLKTSKLIKLK